MQAVFEYQLRAKPDRSEWGAPPHPHLNEDRPRSRHANSSPSSKESPSRLCDDLMAHLAALNGPEPPSAGQYERLGALGIRHAPRVGRA